MLPHQTKMTVTQPHNVFPCFFKAAQRGFWPEDTEEGGGNWRGDGMNSSKGSTAHIKSLGIGLCSVCVRRAGCVAAFEAAGFT